MPIQMRLYLDNNIVAAIARRQQPSQAEALNYLLQAYENREVLLATSDITRDEIQRAPQRHQAPLNDTFDRLAKVPIVRWEDLDHITSDGMGNNWPVLEKDQLYQCLLTLGLELIDAQHVFVAARTSCNAFLTCDGVILHHRNAIKDLCGMVVQRPSDFVKSGSDS